MEKGEGGAAEAAAARAAAAEGAGGGGGRSVQGVAVAAAVLSLFSAVATFYVWKKNGFIFVVYSVFRVMQLRIVLKSSLKRANVKKYINIY